jgi:hypothetical protein
MNFGKHFPKTIYEGKIGILEGLEETIGGGGREKIEKNFAVHLSLTRLK